jgi:hypothetical protein
MYVTLCVMAEYSCLEFDVQAFSSLAGVLYAVR